MPLRGSLRWAGEIREQRLVVASWGQDQEDFSCKQTRQILANASRITDVNRRKYCVFDARKISRWQSADTIRQFAPVESGDLVT